MDPSRFGSLREAIGRNTERLGSRIFWCLGCPSDFLREWLHSYSVGLFHIACHPVRMRGCTLSFQRLRRLPGDVIDVITGSCNLKWNQHGMSWTGAETIGRFMNEIEESPQADSGKHLGIHKKSVPGAASWGRSSSARRNLPTHDLP